jgi:hypothetical protein
MPLWIDLQYEHDCLTYGDGRTVPQGFWVVLRLMRIGEYSQYWNENTKEAVGGSKYNYDDGIVRCINRPGSLTAKRALSMPITDLKGSGSDDVDQRVFAILTPTVPRMPTEDDLLFEIDKHEGVDMPTPPIKVLTRHKILDSYPVYGDNGRIEVIYLSTIRIHGES